MPVLSQLPSLPLVFSLSPSLWQSIAYIQDCFLCSVLRQFSLGLEIQTGWQGRWIQFLWNDKTSRPNILGHLRSLQPKSPLSALWSNQKNGSMTEATFEPRSPASQAKILFALFGFESIQSRGWAKKHHLILTAGQELDLFQVLPSLNQFIKLRAINPWETERQNTISLPEGKA